jgi:HD-like signal output (HDOD) protein/nitrogen-specific signal transduction histidine kinase
MVKPEDNLYQRLLTARLPALPQVLLRFLELSRRDDTGLDDIGRLIAQEPAMAAKVLNLAGSASRYQSQAPRDLLQALLQLGMDSVKTALVAESVHQVFDAFAAGKTVDLGRFWKHSLTAAILARRLAKATGYVRSDEAYLAGLLHDVGQLALVTTLPEQYFKAFSEQHDDTWLANWEAVALGLTHAEVGAWLAGRWQLDSYIADALLYHHEPAERVAVAHPLVRIAWLAHALDRDPEVDVGAFGLDQAALTTILEGVDTEVAQAAKFLGVDLEREDAVVVAQAQLAEEVRPLALAGAQQEIRLSPESELLPRLQAVVAAGRSLYGLGEGILYQPSGDRLQGRVAWLHLQRLEEMAIPIGPDGGCIGMASALGRVTTTWDASRVASILDDQLVRALGGEGLLCLPMAAGRSVPVLVFSLDQAKAAALRSRPLLLENFAHQAAQALGLGVDSLPVADATLQDRLRRAVHEANNPLGIIKNYLHILGERMEGREEAADIALLKAEIDRVGRILRGLAAPEARQEMATPANGVDLNRVIQELIAFCRDTGFIPPNIQVELAVAEGLPRVRANADNLKQVLLNLVKNAVEVLGQEGRLGVVSLGPILQQGSRYVVLRVLDNGPGLPADVRERLFQPVESRKVGGSGLGLAIVGDLVAKLQGRIECRSGEAGTVFEILLPVAAQPGQAE